MQLTIKAIIFDMDGVITDTMPYHFRVWRDVFRSKGIHVTHEDIYTREGQKGIDSLREIFKEHGHPFIESQARLLLRQKEEVFKRVFKRRFITGSRSFIRLMASRGFKLALVTGTSRHEAVKLLPSDLFGRFEATVCGCDVQNGKPHPEPYLKALHKLDLRPSEALVIENAPFGIRSAKAAGLRCVALETSLPKEYLAKADFVFSGFKELNTRLVLNLR